MMSLLSGVVVDALLTLRTTAAAVSCQLMMESVLVCLMLLSVRGEFTVSLFNHV